MPEACRDRMRSADLVLHAGDLVTLAVLDELEALGPPVAAVAGNVDDAAVSRRLPERRVVAAGAARVGMIHDAGPARGRLERLRAAFPDCDAVVFGHSHIPLHERAPDGFAIFNPGSPTDRRRAPAHTMGLARVDRAGTLAFEHLVLD